MANTIARKVNTMTNLQELRVQGDFPAYIWKAVFVNGTQLFEYEDNGTQHLLREIDESKLEKFEIYNEEGKKFSVNVKTGEFDLNGLRMQSYSMPKVLKEDGTSDLEYRIVWFKRIRKDFTPDNGVITTIQYVLGMQTTYEDKNYKQLVWIQEDGSILINGDK